MCEAEAVGDGNAVEADDSESPGLHLRQRGLRAKWGAVEIGAATRLARWLGDIGDRFSSLRYVFLAILLLRNEMAQPLLDVFHLCAHDIPRTMVV